MRNFPAFISDQGVVELKGSIGGGFRGAFPFWNPGNSSSVLLGGLQGSGEKGGPMPVNEKSTDRAIGGERMHSSAKGTVSHKISLQTKSSKQCRERQGK